MVWEERWHPLRREWVIVSSHRNDRPWLGETVDEPAASVPAYDPTCYLCPGNVRISGARNAQYDSVFVFDNDHPCVAPTAPAVLEPAPGIYQSRRADGVARVVCYTPRHDLTLAELSQQEFVQLLQTFQEQYRELGARPEVNHVLAFENKGEVVGVSNPHPHAQIYATNFVFRTIEVEAQASAEHLAEHGRTLFGDVIASEAEDGRRILVDDGSALSFVPYFARYPYETYVAPRETHASVADLSAAELTDFAAVLRRTLVRLDNLWRMSFPYVMVLHQAPTDGAAHPGFHFHIQIHPPLRKPGLLKYLGGPELGAGNFLNDTAPEDKAAELRAVSEVHYARRERDG
ncbi:MAG TPA: galactose-1-phosphate uridylyltransferase [Gemmatimonadaceae bacterium]|nr:galactose-1-phosphate uridylyltransferase [Gemmatimonadaceae bacterium]